MIWEAQASTGNRICQFVILARRASEGRWRVRDLASDWLSSDLDFGLIVRDQKGLAATSKRQKDRRRWIVISIPCTPYSRLGDVLFSLEGSEGGEMMMKYFSGMAPYSLPVGPQLSEVEVREKDIGMKEDR